MPDHSSSTMADVRIDAAVALLLRLQAEFPNVPASELAARAVDATFCTRLTLGADAISCHLDRMRGPLLTEVMRRART